LRQNDCTAARRNLRAYRDKAEQSAIDAEALKTKIAELETVVSTMPEIESKLADAKKETLTIEEELKQVQAAKQTVHAEMSVKTGALQAELDATKKALKSLLSSLDTRQKYEALVEAHEKEWLPHWLQERMLSLVAFVHAASASALRSIDALSCFMLHKLYTFQSILSTLWQLYIVPVLTTIDSVLVSLPGWVDIRNALLQSMHSIDRSARHILNSIFHHILRAEEASEGFALQQLQRVDFLKSIARHDVVHYTFRGAFFSLTVPICFAILQFLARTLLYSVLPGSAEIRNDAKEHQALEQLLGYTFSKADTFKRVFASAEAEHEEFQKESRPGVGRKRLAVLGSAVAHTLAAEEALKLSSSPTGVPQEESTLHTLMQQATAMGITSKSLASAAADIGIAQFVQAGPGARSHRVAQATLVELYSACLGAVYLDSNFDINAARDVRNRKNKGREEGAPAEASSSSSSTPVVEKAPSTSAESGGGSGASEVDTEEEES